MVQIHLITEFILAETHCTVSHLQSDFIKEKKGMSKIEYTDKTINFVTGCSKISTGCQNCYAETMTFRLKEMGQEKYQKGFNEVVEHWDMLPFEFSRTPKRYMINSMSDTFHPEVSFGFIFKMFEQFIHFPQNTFMIFTKRPERASRVIPKIWSYLSKAYPARQFPLENVWLVVTTENQEMYDKRIHYLLDTLVAVRGLSVEPMLSHINFGDHLEQIDWIALGGESGSKGRPMHPSWALSARDQCKSHNTAYWFKQHGEWGFPNGFKKKRITMLIDGRIFKNDDDFCQFCSVTPEELDRLHPSTRQKLGKKKSGNMLEGRTYTELPTLIKN